MASEMLYPVMPVFLLSIGYSVPGIGLLEGFAEATAGLGKGFFGALSDHTQKRVPFVQLGYSISALSKPLMAVFPGLGWVFGCRTADRLGKGIRTSARDALLADESTPENRAKVFGFHRAMDTTGAVAGPMIALGILSLFPGNYLLLFLIAFVPGILAILLTFLIKSKPAKPFIRKPFKPFAFFGYYKKAGKNYKIIVPILLLFALINSSDMFLLMQLKKQGASDVQSIWVYIFYNAVYAITAYPIGKLAGKLGMKKTLVTGLCIFALAYCGIAWAGALWILVLFFGLYGIFTAATDGVTKALISTLCKKEETATAMGFFNGAQSLLALAGGAITGLLWWKFGATFALAFSGIGALVVALLLGVTQIKNEG